MKPTCGSSWCEAEAAWKRPLSFGGRTVWILRCTPCREMHPYRYEFRPIEGSELEVA